MQILPTHITHSFSDMFVDTSFLEKGFRILLKLWPTTLQDSFHQLKVKMLLAVGCSDVGAVLKKDCVLHPVAGQGEFAEQSVGKGSVVE